MIGDMYEYNVGFWCANWTSKEDDKCLIVFIVFLIFFDRDQMEKCIYAFWLYMWSDDGIGLSQ